MIEVTCPTCGKLLRISPEYRGITGKCNGCGGAVYVPANELTPAQRAALQGNEPPTLIEASPMRNWRVDPASERQLSLLAELGATPTMMRNLTKEQASELIEGLQDLRDPTNANTTIAADMAHSQRDMANAQNELVKAAKQHNRFQRNACSLVLLVLLSPFWIPACVYLVNPSDGQRPVPAASGIHAPVSVPSPRQDAPAASEQATKYQLSVKHLKLERWTDDGSKVEFSVSNGSPYDIRSCSIEVTFRDSNNEYLDSDTMIVNNLGAGQSGIATCLSSDTPPELLDSFSVRIQSVYTSDFSIDEQYFEVVLE